MELVVDAILVEARSLPRLVKKKKKQRSLSYILHLLDNASHIQDANMARPPSPSTVCCHLQSQAAPPSSPKHSDSSIKTVIFVEIDTQL